MDDTLLYRLITSDDDYTLFTVVVFKRVHDEFAQKCRENKCVLFRNFSPLLDDSFNILRMPMPYLSSR